MKLLVNSGPGQPPQKELYLTQYGVKFLWNYNPSTGILVWNIEPNSRVGIGDIAGTPDRQGALQVTYNRYHYYIHRIAWIYIYGAWPTYEIDHIDGNRLNNRIDNLRDVPHAENLRNCKTRKDNSSGTVGVAYVSERAMWKAYIHHNNKMINLGNFNTKKEAAEVRRQAEIKYQYHPNHGRK
jgi:hypothetical protein